MRLIPLDRAGTRCGTLLAGVPGRMVVAWAVERRRLALRRELGGDE
jgi:hypothetical protein